MQNYFFQEFKEGTANELIEFHKVNYMYKIELFHFSDFLINMKICHCDFRLLTKILRRYVC